jgi:hypothetical protein
MRAIAAFLIGLLLSVWVSDSKVEADRYNTKHRATLGTWDAMWLNLDDL